MKNSMKKPGLPAALLIALAGAAGMLFLPMLLLAGGLFGYLLIAGGLLPFLVACGLCAGAAYFMVGISGLWLLALLLPPALCMYGMLRRKAPYFDTALFCAALFAAALYMMIGLPDILSGASPFYTVQQSFTQFYQSALAAGADPSAPLSAEQLEPMRQVIDFMAVRLPVFMPAVICAMSALLGLCNLLLCARLCQRAGADIRPMHPFQFWRLPSSFLYGSLTMGAGLLIAPSLNVSAMDAITPAVFVVVLIPFIVQGISVLWFFQRARRAGVFSSLLMLAMISLTIVLSAASLGLVGVLEQLLHIRYRYLNRNSGEKRD